MSSKKLERFGKYILLEKLAMGGMAEIFLAKSSGVHGIGKFIAIKRILPQYSSNQDFIDMFTEEAKICMNLSHSNIAKIHEFGVEQGQFYIAMELITGKNLRQVLSRLSKEERQGFSIDQAVYIAKEVASGLDNAHRCLDNSNGKPLNIIHRDMSPQNIMLSFEGEIKVVDFGIAKAEGGKEETKAGTLKGKFSYMSPEQASGKKIDLRTDVYSLGIVLWEVLANKRLFASSSEINTLNKIREGKVPSISKINPNVPEELERIVNTALAKDPDHRYQTCAEFYKELNRFLNRFYPDFSAHDFSIYVKSLYADEVLENRKKFIEYSKLSKDFNNRLDQNVDATQVTGEQNGILSESATDSSRVNINTSNLRVKTQTSYRQNTGSRTNTKSRSYTKSRVLPAKKQNLVSLPTLTLIGLTLTAVALIISGLSGDFDGNQMGQIDQASVENFQEKNFAKHKMYITSSPSSAEIYINRRSKGVLTPAFISVPANKEFNLGLKKAGYVSYQTTLKSRGNGSKEAFTLQKINVGYLNIYTKYKNAYIYINGRKIRQKTPIRNYGIQAGKIQIKAVDRIRGLTDTKVIQLKADQTVTLKLNPSKPLRK